MCLSELTIPPASFHCNHATAFRSVDVANEQRVATSRYPRPPSTSHCLTCGCPLHLRSSLQRPTLVSPERHGAMILDCEIEDSSLYWGALPRAPEFLHRPSLSSPPSCPLGYLCFGSAKDFQNFVRVGRWDGNGGVGVQNITKIGHSSWWL